MLDYQYFVEYITGLPELEKVVVMPFAGKADEIDLSNIPNRYQCDMSISNLFLYLIYSVLYPADTYKIILLTIM